MPKIYLKLITENGMGNNILGDVFFLYQEIFQSVSDLFHLCIKTRTDFSVVQETSYWLFFWNSGAKLKISDFWKVWL